MVQNHLVELVKQQFKSQNAVACIFVFIAITNFVAMAAYASQQQISGEYQVFQWDSYIMLFYV